MGEIIGADGGAAGGGGEACGGGGCGDGGGGACTFLLIIPLIIPKKKKKHQKALENCASITFFYIKENISERKKNDETIWGGLNIIKREVRRQNLPAV